MSEAQKKLPAVILIVLGVALLIWGFQLSDSAANEISKTFTGASTDEVMYRYISGAVCLVAGLFLFFRKG